jgi:hypothetical protein
MAEYIDKDALIKTTEETPFTMSMFPNRDQCEGANMARHTFAAIFKILPAADVVEVRQIRAFIDRLIAERDKYDLHSMRWEHYDCDRLLIEQMLDEMAGGVNDGKAD